MYTVFTGATGTIDRQFKTIDEAAKYCETTLKTRCSDPSCQGPFYSCEMVFYGTATILT